MGKLLCDIGLQRKRAVIQKLDAYFNEVGQLIERYETETSAYIKMLILRAYTEQDAKARERLRRYNDVLLKYVDETYHIENDYLYSLDVRRFNIVPDNYIVDAERYVTNERAILLQNSI